MRMRTVLLGLLAVLLTALAGAAAVVALRSGEALPGTSVAGVDVGGLDRDQIRERLSGVVSARTTGVLELVHEERRFPVDREALDARTDLDRTVEDAVDAGRTGGLAPVLGPLLAPLFGDDRSVDLAVTSDEAALRDRIEQIGDELDAEPFVGAITVDGTSVTPQPPIEGRTLDRDEAARELEQALARGREEPLPLPVAEQDPGTTAAQVEQVATEARDVLSAPYRLTAPEGSIAVSPAELGPLLSAEPLDPVTESGAPAAEPTEAAAPAGEDAELPDVPEPPPARVVSASGLRLAVDREALAALVVEAAERLDRPATDAGFVPAGPPPTVDTQGNLTWTPQPATLNVTPSATGLAVDTEAAVDTLLGLVGTPQREGALVVGPAQPALSTEQAQAAGVTSLLGTFTTYYTAGQPRAQNIRRIAELVDGAYVPSGERFSLNGHVGPRTRAKGFVADGAIINGELEDVVGGGVSQFATTLFNASFFAGLPIEQHQPHSFYISRYPAGRESTVNFGTIDVRVRNDTANGMVIKTSTTSSSVTVSVYGDNGGRVVTSTTGPREPRDGGGFRINVTRTIEGGDGRGERRVFRTTYNPPPD